MEARLKLLQQLANGRFHSGQQLAANLGISRAAVWKHLKRMTKEYGIEVDAIRGKGYRLRQPLELLSIERIESQLSERTQQLLNRFHLHLQIDSTNNWLMRQAELAAESGTACIAEQQTAGKGRHGRIWVSPFGRNIYLSLLWRFELAPSELAGMSLAAGIAVIRTLRNFNCLEAGLKWPNDVHWQGKKLAGLLLEVAGEATGPAHIVIGVGLNLRMDPKTEAIDQPWIDMASIPEVAEISRNEMVSVLLENLVDVIEDYRNSGLSGFIDEWNCYDLLKGEQVVVRSPNRVYQGEHRGIDASGGLVLEIDGKPQTFYAGEVSLRSVTG